MKREEAIEIVHKNYPHVGFSSSEFETALRELIPELAESEDERIRKEIIHYILYGTKETVGKDTKNTWIAYLEKQKEQIKWPHVEPISEEETLCLMPQEQKPAIMKPHKGDGGNPYDMGVSEAQEYAIKRGFGIPFNDGEVFVDERYITQTIGNILRWADEHPKEQKPAEWSEEDEKN